LENRSKVLPFLKFWLPVYLFAAVIFILSSIPFLGKLPGPKHIDKVCHMAEYAVFGFLLARAFKNSDRSYWRANFQFLAIAFALLYGLTDEIHQKFVDLRNPSVFDLFFDGLGAVIGSILCKSEKGSE